VSQGKGRIWNFAVVDTENRRRKQDTDKINADLEARKEQFRKSVSEMYSRAKYVEQYTKEDE